MRPEFFPEYDPIDLYEVLLAGVSWVDRGSPRRECFMAAAGAPQVYSYGNNNEVRSANHTYTAVEMHPAVIALMTRLNAEFGTSYNICVLNYYGDRHQHLGWHADDSPEQDPLHPIAVIAFGAARQLWIKERGTKGEIPAADKFTMSPGDLFVMPPGFQDAMLHRIPKHDRECGGRISLTYRRLVK